MVVWNIDCYYPTRILPDQSQQQKHWKYYSKMWNVFKVKKVWTLEWWQLTLIWCLYCQLSADFTHSSGYSIGDFEQVNAGSVDEL